MAMDKTGLQKVQLFRISLIVRGLDLTSQLFSMLNVSYDWSAKLLKRREQIALVTLKSF